ncbi:MAG: c-type cytochrome [Pseudomonadota bacterium]
MTVEQDGQGVSRRRRAAPFWHLAALSCAIAAVAAAAQTATPAVVAFTIRDGREIAESLTGGAGDAAAGLRLYLDGARTGCAVCHGLPDAPGVASLAAHSDTGPLPTAAEAGPPLDRVGTRLGAGEIRLWLVAPAMHAPETAMPAYYALGQRRDITDPLFDGPRLTAGEIEDLVAWLSGLTGTE